MVVVFQHLSTNLRSLYRRSTRSADVRCLGAFRALNDVEEDLLVLAKTSQVLVGVVIGDGGLMDEDVLTGVGAVDEAVAVLHVEPLHGTVDSFRENLQIDSIKFCI